MRDKMIGATPKNKCLWGVIVIAFLYWAFLWLLSPFFLNFPMLTGFVTNFIYVTIDDDLLKIISPFICNRGPHCHSFYETCYRGGCHPIGRGEHCPHNSFMVLYDGPNNEGYCDCQNNISGGNGLFPIYSNKTDKCHFQHTQVLY